MLELGLKIFLSYLIGSFNGSLLVGKYLGGVDIRKIGSGNAGGTNALRTQGKVFAFLVISIDVGKGIIPVVLLPTMTMFGTDSLEVSREWLTYVCGAAVIFGHCFPVWFDFSGGKGAATTIGVLLGTSPFILSVGMIIWLLILVLIGYVGLATVISAFAVPIILTIIDYENHKDLILFTTMIAFFILFTHRSNIRKLIFGKPSRDISFSLWSWFSGK